jgi:hypothetical protein
VSSATLSVFQLYLEHLTYFWNLSSITWNVSSVIWYASSANIIHYSKLLVLVLVSCCRTAVGVGQRALSLSAHTAGGPPPLLAPGRVTSPRHILGV